MAGGLPSNESSSCMEHNLPRFLKNYFLMALPALTDPNFRRSVTCISEHTEEGAVGLVVNYLREGLNAAMIFRELAIDHLESAERIPIYTGGPVHTHELFVLHTAPLEWEGSLIISDDLALSNSRSILEAIAQGDGPRAFIIALGCAGWGPGQLEWELGQNAWLTSPSSHDLIFDTPAELKWEKALRKLGIDPAALSETAGHA